MSLPTINSTTRRKREAERSVNWTVEETQVLLCAWSDQRVQKSLSENLRNRHVFKHLSARMSEMGFCRSPHQCRLRVKTLKANYARAKLQRKSDASQMCTFKYFDEMDAVLGRPADGSGVGPRFPAPIAEFGDQFFSSPGRDQLSSSEEKGGRHPWQLGFHVKMENGEDSEFSDAGFPELPRERHKDVYLASTVHPEPPAAPSLEVASSPPPPVIVAAPTAPDEAAPASARLPDDSCLRMEPALQHLSQCYQQLLSETRALLTQLERQRQEQATWHQDLLGQWIQRQQEAADREERREKAHMDHQIQVLELLTCLVREQQCKCGSGVTTTTSGRAAEVSSELHHLFTKGEN